MTKFLFFHFRGYSGCRYGEYGSFIDAPRGRGGGCRERHFGKFWRDPSLIYFQLKSLHKRIWQKKLEKQKNLPSLNFQRMFICALMIPILETFNRCWDNAFCSPTVKKKISILFQSRIQDDGFYLPTWQSGLSDPAIDDRGEAWPLVPHAGDVDEGSEDLLPTEDQSSAGRWRLMYVCQWRWCHRNNRWAVDDCKNK